MAVDQNGFQIVGTDTPQVTPAASPVGETPIGVSPVKEPSPSVDQNGFQLVGEDSPINAKHDESDRFDQEDPNDNWLEKTWHFANKPLTESLFGWGEYRQGAGGLERGAEKILSGLTSPLSLLTAAAFAPASIAESVGGSVLKEGLMEGGTALGEAALDASQAAGKVEGYAKAVQAAEKARIAGGSIEGAVTQSSGMPYQEFLNMGQYLRNQGLRESDMLNESFARRFASKGLAKAGFGPDKALKIAKGAETLVNAGFALQQIKGAVYAYPRVADLMSQGDYDGAAEYMVEAGAGTIFGGLGIAHGLHSIKDLVGVDEGPKLALSDETEMMKRVFDKMDGRIGATMGGIAARKREHMADMLEWAGLDVPARLRDSATGIDEATSAFKELFQNKATAKKLEDAQMEMYFRMDHGNDYRLTHQARQALVQAYKLENDPEVEKLGYNPVPRTKEDIAREEAGDGLFAAKTKIEQNQGWAQEASSQINGLKEQLKKSKSPQETDALNAELVKAEANHKDLQLARIELQKQYDKAKEWENPTQETYEEHYRDLMDKVKQAYSETGGKLEDFNNRVRVISNHPDDILLLEKEFPEFKHGPVAPSSRGEYLYHGTNQETSSIQPGSYFTNDPNEALAHALKRTSKPLEGDGTERIYAVPRSEVENTAKELIPGEHYLSTKEHAATDVTKSVFYHPENKIYDSKPADYEARIKGLQDRIKDFKDQYWSDENMQKIEDAHPAPPAKIAEDVAREWALKQRELKGDRFATEDEMKFNLDDPLGAWGGDPDLHNWIDNELQEQGYRGWYKSRGGYRFDHNETPEAEKYNSKLATLYKQVDSLKGLDLGQVHKLPDGTKVLYLTPESMKRVELFAGKKKVPSGTVMDKYWINAVKRGMADNKGYDKKTELNSLLDNAINSNGTLVIATKGRSEPLYAKLHTLREEVIHNWQHSLKNSFLSHLPSEARERIFDAIPRSMRAHLSEHGYENDQILRTLEAPAKMMATDPANVMMPYNEVYAYNRLSKKLREGTALTEQEQIKYNEYDAKAQKAREQAATFLHKYFTEIKAAHGESAFDTLTHITTRAKQLKNEFLGINDRQQTRPEPTPDPGTTEGTVGSMGEGGGGGDSEGPPEPPEPPEPEPDEPEWRKALDGYFGSHFPLPSWMDGPQHPYLPHDLIQQVEKARGKNFKPEQVEYAKRIAGILAKIEKNPLNDKGKSLYDKLVKAEQDNWTEGFRSSIIKSIVDNHIHHIFPKKQVGNELLQHAGSGAFAINATQAKHRVYQTAFEGILRGHQLAVHDPVALAAHDANNIAQAAGHREALLNLRSSGMKDPEGMPIAALYGRGNVVPGIDGDSSAKIIVDPNRIRNVEMQPNDIQRLTESGLLPTYIKDGRVVDQTPQASIDNVKDWIHSTQEKIKKLEERNPLLASSKTEMDRHKAAWGQLHDFARQQSGKIADYLDEVTNRLRNKGPMDGGFFSAINPAEKPGDFQMASYLDKILHNLGGKITPSQLKRIEDYAERNRKYSEGESSLTEGDIRPSEVSRLLLQERKFMSPELQKYLTDIHDRFGKNKKDANGNPIPFTDWTKKGINDGIKHIAHAVENPQYPQLIKDLSDLKYVDNVLNTNEGNLKPWKETDTPPPINPKTIEENRKTAEARLQDLNDRQEKRYYWAPKSHIVPDHYAFQDYQWMATAPDGTPTLAQSNMGISRHYYQYLVNRLGIEPSWLRKNPVTGTILKAGAEAKNLLLSVSPFHIVQEALRGLMLHVNPFVRPNPIENVNETFDSVRGKLPLIRLGVENHLTLFTDRHSAEDMSVGVASHGGIVSKIPVYGKVADQIHDFLFNRYIPDLKARSFRRLFDKYASAHSDWSDDAVAQAAAEHTNAAFGGINWRALGRASTTQDWFHLAALAPDWLESEMRFMGGLFKNAGIGPAKFEPESGRNFSREQVLQAAAVLWTTARVLNLATTGNAHYEAPFGLAHKDADGKETIFSVRTLPTDMLHMASDPMGFLVGRESPFLRTGIEAYTGRNQYGQKLTDGEKYVDLLSNLSPIWGQSLLKQAANLATSSDIGTGAQLWKSGGGTSQIYRTPAQKLAANLAAERSEEGSMNPAKIARHRLMLQLEDEMRNGKIKTEDLTSMVDYGNLPEADAKAIVKNVKETAGEDPETARLYSRVSRLDFAGAYTVWESANPAEKQMLEKVINKKAKAYLKQSRKEFTPDQRQKDPMFQVARRIAPAIEPE